MLTIMFFYIGDSLESLSFFALLIDKYIVFTHFLGEAFLFSKFSKTIENIIINNKENKYKR